MKRTPEQILNEDEYNTVDLCGNDFFPVVGWARLTNIFISKAYAPVLVPQAGAFAVAAAQCGGPQPPLRGIPQPLAAQQLRRWRWPSLSPATPALAQLAATRAAMALLIVNFEGPRRSASTSASRWTTYRGGGQRRPCPTTRRPPRPWAGACAGAGAAPASDRLHPRVRPSPGFPTPFPRLSAAVRPGAGPPAPHPGVLLYLQSTRVTPRACIGHSCRKHALRCKIPLRPQGDHFFPLSLLCEAYALRAKPTS